MKEDVDAHNAHHMRQQFSIALKPHRKRSGFTQEEIAFLLGVKEHSKICRFEHGDREPNFRTALAYQVLFDSGLEKLFPKVVEEVRRELAQRAALMKQEIGQDGKKKSSYKLKKLARLIQEEAPDDTAV